MFLSYSKIAHHVLESKCSFPYSQHPATFPHPKPHESSPHPSILFLYVTCIRNWNFNVQITTDNRQIGIVAACSVFMSDILTLFVFSSHNFSNQPTFLYLKINHNLNFPGDRSSRNIYLAGLKAEISTADRTNTSRINSLSVK